MRYISSVLSIALGIAGLCPLASAQEVQLVDDGAVLAGQFVQATQVPTQRTAASVAMQNTGSTTWTREDGYALANASPGGAFGFGTLELAPGSAVAPGQIASFNFTISGPAAAGLYPFQVQMSRNGEPFGAPGAVVIVNVDPRFANNSLPISQDVPRLQFKNGNYRAFVTLRNEGVTTWTANGGYFLTSVTRDFFRDTPIPAGVTVAPTQTVTFELALRSPRDPGNYTFQAQMAQNGVLFGLATPSVGVLVEDDGSCPGRPPCFPN